MSEVARLSYNTAPPKQRVYRRTLATTTTTYRPAISYGNEKQSCQNRRSMEDATTTACQKTCKRWTQFNHVVLLKLPVQQQICKGNRETMSLATRQWRSQRCQYRRGNFVISRARLKDQRCSTDAWMQQWGEYELTDKPASQKTSYGVCQCDQSVRRSVNCWVAACVSVSLDRSASDSCSKNVNNDCCRNWFDELLSTCCNVFWCYGLENYFSGCRGGRLACIRLISASYEASVVASWMQVWFSFSCFTKRLLFPYSLCINLIIMPVKTDSNWSGLSPPPPPRTPTPMTNRWPTVNGWFNFVYCRWNYDGSAHIVFWSSCVYCYLHIYIHKIFW